MAERRDRIDRAMRLALGAQLRQLELRCRFSRRLGSAAPFIGLFGTVWGIMRSFNAIAAANNTSLAVVAPGIADALFATAMGLAAAIPAVVAYNKFTVEIGRFAGNDASSDRPQQRALEPRRRGGKLAMAMALPPSGDSGEDRYAPLAEINVTPMVDVMLVLLVIFMVAAPLLTVGVPINLPKTSAAQVTEPQQPLVVSMNAAGETFIGDNPVAGDDLKAQLTPLAAAGPDPHRLCPGRSRPSNTAS
jgi:biopolymer transport protein ExbD